jgi:Cu/Ag efflux pump CusA
VEKTKQFQVLIDPAKLRDYGLTLRQVMDAVAGSNVNSPEDFSSGQLTSF